MSIVVNIYYSGENGSAQKFAKEMISSGTVDAIRNEAGNIRYDYCEIQKPDDINLKNVDYIVVGTAFC